MRTAVIRINVDPAGELSQSVLRERTAAFVRRADSAGIGVIDSRLDTLPATQRVLQLLLTGNDSVAITQVATELCAEVFHTTPTNGAVTYLSRGTDEDALGVLAGFGITGRLSRTAGEDGLDIITVHLTKGDLDRIPESRVQTALEASLNCEVRIVTS